MLLDLKDIFVSDGESKDVSYPLSMSDVEISGEHPFNSPVEIRGICVTHAIRKTKGVQSLSRL